MRYEYRIRFGQQLRAVRPADPNAALAPHAGSDPTARALAAAAAANQLAEEERQAVEEALAGLAEAAESLRSTRNELLGQMQQVAVELATAIATRVTYDKLDTDRFAVEELVQAVVSRLDTPGLVRVRLHPDDLALLQRRSSGTPGGAPPEFQFIPDATLARGDCVADAGDVSFTACLEEQLSDIRQHLLRNLSDAQIERRKAATGDRELRRFPDRRQTA